MRFTLANVSVTSRVFLQGIATRCAICGGDPSTSASIVEQCNGCDVLIHEVQIRSVRQLSELATRARPELLILHADESSEDELMRAMRAVYRGRFLVGHDLDVF